MNGFSIVLVAVVAAQLASSAAMAQTQPPQTSPPAGSLHQPTAAERGAAAAPAKPPVADPRTAVQKAAPHKAQKPPRAKSVLGHSAPGQPVKPGAKPAPTPVVRAPATGHAQKPAPAKPGAPAKPVAGAAVAAPVAGKEAPKAAEPAATAQPPNAATVESPKGSVTSMPLPRWASLKADEVNLRTGPGTRYPIEWVYHRVNLPVQIEREFEVWRLIEDQDGVKGWVHQATLTGRRSFVVKGDEQVMRHTASATAAAVARLKPGVVGQLRTCDAKTEWCEVQVNDYRGFLRRADLYGIYPGESVN
jgi:SH3-like domain-containing protein